MENQLMKKQQFNKDLFIQRELPENNLTEREIRSILFREIDGFIETVDTIPSYTPRRINEQIKFYSSGTTYRLYIYDIKNQVWRYTALT